jgi:hypothetical protein
MEDMHFKCTQAMKLTEEKDLAMEKLKLEKDGEVRCFGDITNLDHLPPN